MQEAGYFHRNNDEGRATSTLCVLGIVLLGLAAATAKLVASTQSPLRVLGAWGNQREGSAVQSTTAVTAAKTPVAMNSVSDSGGPLDQASPLKTPGFQRAPHTIRVATPGGWWIASFTLVLGLGGCAFVAARRYLLATTSSPLKVVGRISLSPKHVVYLVQVGQRKLLIGTGPQGTPSLISEFADCADVAVNVQNGDEP
jgi:Flagellar biosynthesis protein, FliO